MAIEELTAVAPAATAAVGALAGGGGVAWLAKVLFSRMINQYDKRLDDQDERAEKLTEKLADAKESIAVLRAMFDDTKTMRTDFQAQVSKLEGEFKTRIAQATGEINDLRVDLYVAHERIRLLATGDTDLSKITKPEKIRR